MWSLRVWPLAAVLGLVWLPACHLSGSSATYSNEDGFFVLMSNGSFLQSLPDDTGQRGQPGQPDRFPGSYGGQWRLMGPRDGPGANGFSVEMSGVRHREDPSLTNSYTIIVPAGAIQGMEKLLRSQKDRPQAAKT